jgi:hypothetical protein
MDKIMGVFLLNLLIAILAFFAVRWIAAELTAPNPIGVVLGLIAAILVFYYDVAQYVIKS